MAEAVLFHIAESVANKAIGTLGSPVLKELGMLWGLKGELQKLQDTVLAIQAVLLDAEEKQVGDNAVRHWLARLEVVVYEADNLLDDFSTEGLLREMMIRDKKAKKVRLFFSKSNQLYYGLKMAHKIKAVREKLGAIKDDKEFLLLENRTEEKIGVSSSEGRDSHSFVLAEEVFGREDDKERLIGLLMESNLRDNVAILSIVGFGGLGKTTLGQLLFNDNRIQKHFEVQMWVCVSLDFDVKKIVEKMIESAKKKKPEAAEMDTLITKLREVIEGKKYFLVLDDVWEEDGKKWDELEKVLRCGARGSRVLVTTRNETVAKTIRSVESYSLNGLDDEGSWSLFKQMAFENGEEPESARIIEIGREIVKKCQGVPLLIRTIGRLLYSRRSETEWSSFQEKELAKINEKEMVETLKLSYNCLPSHLKHCFAYCSIFPKADCYIDKSILINLWIAQGFIIKSTGQSQCLEDIANDYFMELLWRSFFQEAQTDKFGDIDNCKMHDFMHDLAVKVSGSSSTTFDSKNKLFDESKTRHVAIGDFDFLSAVPTLFSKPCTMRTLLFQIPYLCESTLNAIFSNLKLLRTLELRDSEIDVVPSSISKLKHLRFLDLSGNEGIKKLPYSITRLQNLHTLRLIGCLGLEELPRDIKKLINLRHLEIEGCFRLTCMPRGLGQLTNLMTLSFFVVNWGGGVSGNSGGLDELNGLNSLRGKSVIRESGHGKEVASEYKAANLKDKQHLHTLVLKWIDNVVDDDTQLEGLEPHPNLKKLSLKNYGGMRFPNWLLSLTNIVNLRVDSCENLKYLPPLSQMLSLNHLSLRYLYELEYILDSNMVSASSSIPVAYFPSLKEMQLDSCPKLKGWCRTMGSLETTTVTWMEDYPLLPSFRLLSELSIVDCPMLTSMPTFPHLEEFRLLHASWKPLQQTMMMNVAALESRSAAIASPALVASSPTPLSKLKSLKLILIEDLRYLPEEGLRNLISLQDLSINSCKRLETLSRSIQHLTALQTLELRCCDELDLGKDDDWMQWQGLKSLKTLTIDSLPKLVSLPHEWLRNLTSLQDLSLRRCDELDLGKDDDWMQWQGLKSLRTLIIYFLPKLVSLPSGLQHLTTLRAFEIDACFSLIAIPDWIHKWTSLEEFTIRICTSLTSLPEGMCRLTSLRMLKIVNCPILLQRCKRDKGKDWPKIAHIPNLRL